MKIRSMKVKNFRSLKDIQITFEEDLTCIVGENDSGKTSLLHCLRVFSKDSPYRIREEDFFNLDEPVEIELELSNGMRLQKVFKLYNGSIEAKSKIYIPKEILQGKLETINSNLSEEEKGLQLRALEKEKRIKLEEISKEILGQKPSPNKKVENLINELAQKLKSIPEEHEVESDISINIYYLDNRTIQEPERVIEELFLKDIKREIWNAKVTEDKSIREIVEEKIKEMKSEREEKFKHMLEEKLKNFLHYHVQVVIEPILNENPISITFRTKFIDDTGKEIVFENKGEGTKRRITMGLLEFKMKEQNKDKDVNIFIFDEPDTHLHIKAQRDLLEIFKRYSTEKQIILTTHSPFIINLIKPSKIRVFYLKNVNGYKFTNAKTLSDRHSDVEKLLKNLGIENTILFFGRKILITEEETMKTFIEHLYYYLYNIDIYGDFIKIIVGRGVTDAPRLVKVIIEDFKYDTKQVMLIVDKDIEERNEKDPIHRILRELKKYGLDEEKNLFKIGKKEFEDAFEPEVIYEAWKIYVEKRGYDVSKNWVLENIRRVYRECLEKGKKLRKELKSLNAECRVGFDHVHEFPKALAEYFAEHRDKTPKEIKELLRRLRES